MLAYAKNKTRQTIIKIILWADITTNKHKYNTRAANANLLDIIQSNKVKCGTFSCKNQFTKEWNNFKKTFRNVKLSELAYKNYKTFFSKQVQNPYI